MFVQRTRGPPTAVHLAGTRARRQPIGTKHEYVTEVVNQKKLRIPEIILVQTQTLIQICEQHDLLLDHTPLSIGVSVFYYILKANNIICDPKIFSQIYDLSIVTVIKTYNKLLQYKSFIDKHLCI